MVTYSDRLNERIAATKREINELLPVIWELMPRAPDPILGRRPGLNPLLSDLTPEEMARLDALCNRHYMLNQRVARDNRTLQALRAQRSADLAPDETDVESDVEADLVAEIDPELVSDGDPELISDVDPNAPPEPTAGGGHDEAAAGV